MAGVTLVDSNVLLRLLQPHHSQYPAAARALSQLHNQNADLCVAPQNLVEFWVVATRPIPNNGLGLSPLIVAGQVRVLRSLFRLLEGNAGVADAWEKLVGGHLVSGKLAHDAHLVAVMQIYGVPSILTFNGGDFQRFSGITILDPDQL